MKDEKTKKVSPAKSGTSKSREKKEKIVAGISEKLSRAKALVFTNYQGLTHKQLEELKKALKNSNAELAITKNTLLKKALESTDYGLRTTAVDGSQSTVDFDLPTATLFAYEDPIAPLKELAKSIKNFKLPTIKFGVFDGKVVNEQDVLRLSTLPSKEILLAQLVGGLKAPIYGLHRALNWNLQKLVMTLKAVETKKGVK